MAQKTTTQALKTVFYAWQSDSPPQENRFFIREALKGALRMITKSGDGALPLKYDDATRNAAGSVMIVDSILAKIDACDVFVGDISIISSAEEGSRRVPNPNVMMEVGWAAARLGWNRVVLIFNKATGKIETDVPFDVRGRLILQYEFSSSTADKKTVEKTLEGILAGAIRAALASPPPIRSRVGARSLKTISTQQQRERDCSMLHRLLNHLDTRWVDDYLASLQDERMPLDEETHYLVFTGVLGEVLFKLFDRRTEAAIRAFASAWGRMHDASRYGDAIVGTRHVRFRPESYANGQKVDRMRFEFHDARECMHAAFHGMVSRLHKAYPEFDLRDSDKRAREYIAAL